MQSKKKLILLVLKLLESESDEKHPITQTALANTISKVYPCDRKTVCRNIKFLQEMGYPIKKAAKGFYIENKIFSVEEIQFVKSAILSYSEASDINKSDLAEKVSNVIVKMIRR